jgi:hypothetical protein
MPLNQSAKHYRFSVLYRVVVPRVWFVLADARGGLPSRSPTEGAFAPYCLPPKARLAPAARDSNSPAASFVRAELVQVSVLRVLALGELLRLRLQVSAVKQGVNFSAN